MDAINNFRLMGEGAELLKERYHECLNISKKGKEIEATGEV